MVYVFLIGVDLCYQAVLILAHCGYDVFGCTRATSLKYYNVLCSLLWQRNNIVCNMFTLNKISIHTDMLLVLFVFVGYCLRFTRSGKRKLLCCCPGATASEVAIAYSRVADTSLMDGTRKRKSMGACRNNKDCDA